MSENEPEEELYEVFKMFDKNNDERVDHLDLRMIFEELGEKVTDDECRIMIKTHDIDGDEELSFEEFVNLMMAN